MYLIEGVGIVSENPILQFVMKHTYFDVVYHHGHSSKLILNNQLIFTKADSPE